jgi:hypothetical protein
MTHLHFDLTAVRSGIRIKPVMNRLLKRQILSNENHWEWLHNQTEKKASFLSENILPMQESGQLNFIKRPTAISWKNQNWVLNFLCRSYRKANDPSHSIQRQNDCFLC